MPKFIITIIDWLREHEAILWIAGVGSVVILIASALIMPAIIARIPADYFAHEKRPPSSFAHRHQFIRLLIDIGSNALGVMLMIAGVAMLALPGQGLLTLIVGFFLVSFPGKYRFECWLVARRPVRRVMNWLRRRAGREPLVERRPTE